MSSNTLALLFLLVSIAFSCDRIGNGAKDVLHEGGRKAGRVAGEVMEGMADGVERSFDVELGLSESIRQAGVSSGEFHVKSDSTTDDLLAVYLIFEQRFEDTVLARVINQHGLEKGRVYLPVKARAGQAGYYDFRFDPRTNMDAKDHVEIGLKP